VTQISFQMEANRNQDAQLALAVLIVELFLCTVSKLQLGRVLHCNNLFQVESVVQNVNNRLRAQRCATADDAATGNCSLEPAAFLGGEPSNQINNVRGIYHLTTNAASPFGQG
jgi:hypothetical protein